MSAKRISWTETSGAPTRAVAVVATCGLIFGLGSASPGGSIPGTGSSQSPLSADSSGAAAFPADVSDLFGHPRGSMVPGPAGSFGPGLSGLDDLLKRMGIPGFWAAGGLPSAAGLFEAAVSPGISSDSATPGSALLSQPGPAIKGGLAAVVPFAYEGLGRPYVWGGTSFTSGWDCSGFTQWAFARAGFTLPRVSQWEALRPTSTPSPGDLVAQRPDGPNHWGHVGIYVGDGMMISALNPDQGTILHPVGATADQSWYFTLPGTERGPVASEPLTRRPDVSQPFNAPSSPTPKPAASTGKQQDATRGSTENNDTERDSRSDRGDSNSPAKQPPKRQDANQRSTENIDPDRGPRRDRGDSVKQPPKRQDPKPAAPEKPNRPAPSPSAPPSSAKPNKPGPTVSGPKPSQPSPEPTAPALTPGQPEPSPTAPQKPVVPVSTQAAIIAALEDLKETSPESLVQVDSVLASVGVDYLAGAANYSTLGKEVDAAAAVPGDLVYYPDDGTGKPHVAIYTGKGKAVHNGQSTHESPVENGMPFIYIHIGN